MKTLSATLLEAQRSPSRTPYVKVTANNAPFGVVRLKWERLYSGEEADGPQGMCLAGDGSLIRSRITPEEDNRRLLLQRVESPGPSSDFSQWTDTGAYNCLAAAIASCGATVSMFWVNLNHEIRRMTSTDNGANWGWPEVIDYAASTSIGGITAAFKPNGDVALFYADQSVLSVKKATNGEWQQQEAWDKSTGQLSGVAATYDGDWNILLTGQDASGDFKVWSLCYGDGGDVSGGVWSDLKEIETAPADGAFSYRSPSIDKTDVIRACYVEVCWGAAAYSTPFFTNMTPDSNYADGLWREPTPFDVSCGFGPAVAHSAGFAWLSTASGVWRAALGVNNVDLSADILSVRIENSKATIELTDKGTYTGLAELLGPGFGIDVSPGYVTAMGNETGAAYSFQLESREDLSGSAILRGVDGWGKLASWRANSQFRWNGHGEGTPVKEILAFVWARVGLRFDVVSNSDLMDNFGPDFTIQAGDRGDAAVKKLLSFVPDLLFVDENIVRCLNPMATDASVHSYGTEHAVIEGASEVATWQTNSVTVEGEEPETGAAIVVKSVDWGQVGAVGERHAAMRHASIGSVEIAGAVGAALLRKAEIGSGSGLIRVPVNCGQEQYNVVDITSATNPAVRKRVMGMTLVYRAGREYEHRLALGQP